MSPWMVMPLSGLTLWLAAIYIDSKFDYQSPAERTIALRADAPWWRRLIVNFNWGTKYGALFGLWFFLMTDLHLRQWGLPREVHYFLVFVSAVSILVYALAHSWRFFVRDSDRL